MNIAELDFRSRQDEKAQFEQSLLRGSQEFDLEALGQVYDLYSDGIYRYAIRLLGNAKTAEDCVSDTFARYLSVLKTGRGPRQYLQAYLFRIAHNWINDYYKQRPYSSESLENRERPSEADVVETEVDHHDQAERLRKALLSLSSDQRLVASLRFIEDWELDEVAMVLGKPIGAVKSLQHRALANLKKELGRE